MKWKKQRDLTEKEIPAVAGTAVTPTDEMFPTPEQIEQAAEEMRKRAEKARFEREERRRAAMARFIETGEGLPNWITVHRRGSPNTVAVQHIRNVFPYEIETDEGKTLTRIAFITGTVLDVDETVGEVREKIWTSENYLDFCPDEMYKEICL